MITKEQIKEAMAQAIKNSGMSKTSIAAKIGVSQQTISKYINAKTMPSIEIFVNLCKILDLDANEILCITKGKFN